MATLEDLEARVAALEAAQADYRAVLTAINAIGANQRDHATAIGELKTNVAGLKTDVAGLKTDVAGLKTEFRGFRRSTEESFAELKDLIVGLRDA